VTQQLLDGARQHLRALGGTPGDEADVRWAAG
jgi:hypothetical protein